MFNKDFYPTNQKTCYQMVPNASGKIVLEPHGGSGNLIDHLKAVGADMVLTCEKNEKLAEISKQKADEFLGYDFLELKKKDVAHIDMIVMNPPFSEQAAHIEHAINIAPEGCHIVSLCNYDSFTSRRYTDGRRVRMEVENYGHIENIGDAFSDAERTTDIDIGLINMFKPLGS